MVKTGVFIFAKVFCCLARNKIAEKGLPRSANQLDLLAQIAINNALFSIKQA